VTGTAAADSPGRDEPDVAVLWTVRDDPVEHLRAGQALTRLLLTATVHGAAASLLDQPVELPALRALLRQQAGIHGYPQVVLRLGFGESGVASPRRPVEEVLQIRRPTTGR
jgi:hypothetical protein